MNTKLIGLFAGIGLSLTLVTQVSATSLALESVGPAPEVEAPSFVVEDISPEKEIAGIETSFGCDNGECERGVVGESVTVTVEDNLPIDYSTIEMSVPTFAFDGVATLATVDVAPIAVVPVDHDIREASAGKLGCGMGLVFRDGAQVDNSCK